MLGQSQAFELGRAGDGLVEGGAQALGGLGGVLSQVPGDLPLGPLASARVDGAEVELLAPADRWPAQRAREGDLGGGLAQGGGQQLDAGPGGWWGVGVGAVQADDDVEVDCAAFLVFGHLDIRYADLPAGLGGEEAGLAGQGPAQVDGGPPPELGRQGVPEDRPGVVVAVGTERRAQGRVATDVAVGAAARTAVGAARLWPGGPADLDSAAADPAGVDGAEGGGGEGDEQPGMPGDRYSDACAADHARLDELVGVSPIHLGTRRATGGPAGAARLEQQPVRLPGGVEHRPGFPPGGVDVVDAAHQADRSLAVARGANLAAPLRVVARVASAGAQVSKKPVADCGMVRFPVGGCGFF